MPAGQFTGATSDYSAVTVVRKWNILVNPLPTEPALNDIGQRHGILRGSSQDPTIASLSGTQMGIASVTDGTSNTFMICEVAGLPDLYNAQHTTIASVADATIY